jgi:hypothetical protein
MRAYEWTMVACLLAVLWLGFEGRANAQLLLMFGMLLIAGVHELFDDDDDDDTPVRRMID